MRNSTPSPTAALALLRSPTACDLAIVDRQVETQDGGEIAGDAETIARM